MRKLISIALMLLLLATPANAATPLTALVTATWGARDTPATLEQIAAQRASEIAIRFDPATGVAPNFNHDGQRTDNEVIAWNQGVLDPLGTFVTQWLSSPLHNLILSDSQYGQIGCGVYSDGSVTFGACVLSRGGAFIAPNPAPGPAVPQPSSAPILLPNTAVAIDR